jgi:hypothetical protein
MSEPRANPPHGDQSSPPPEGPRAEPPAPVPANVDAIFGANGGSAEPTDETPTVISKGAPKSGAVASEDAFTGSLRGRQLAHFELIEPIGVGGMAAVLRARDTQLDREVALKILPPEMAADPENVRRFHQEARSAAKLDHETIARVFFCGEDQRLHFIAFEFVEGDNLRTLIDKRGRLPAAEALRYLLQIASGLVHAASRGVVHRDIKPSNIIITPAGRAKLVDMGLARSLERSHDDGLTQSGVTLGTFDYISPEQALEPREADARSDIYSLGCTFYHVLTGQPPVPEGTAARKLHHHHHVKPIDPRQLTPDLPDVVAATLSRMMAKRPVDRYQSPEELVQDLVRASRVIGCTPDSIEGTVPAAAAAPLPAAGRPLVLAGLAALLVVGLVLFADPGGTAPRPPSVAVTGTNPDAGGNGSPESGEPDKQRTTKTKPPPVVPKHEVVTRVQKTYDGPARADALVQWAADAKAEGATDLEVVLSGDLTLVADDPEHPCPLFEAARVIVRPKYHEQRPTIKLSHRSPASQPLTPWAALTVSGEEVTIEGVRFVINAAGGNYKMVGLRLVGGGRYHVKDCEFVQVMPSFDPVERLASVRAEGGGGRASLSLEECCFLGYMGVEEVSRPGMDQPAALQPWRVERGGQDAVVRHGAVRLEAVNCAFGPHAAAFRFEGAPTVPEERVADIRHCSVLAGSESAAFDFAERASADLRVEACLFSRPPEAGGGMGNDSRAVLLRQTAPPGNPPMTYSGKDNRYHNLDGAWLTADGPPAIEWSEFSRKLQDASGNDVRALFLADNPWDAAQPLKELERPPPARPGQAFRPNGGSLDLRVPAPGGRETVAGVERLAQDDFTANLESPSPQKPSLLGQRERLVDPTAEDDPAHRIYVRLEDAVHDAASGDVIRIRHRERLSVGPLRTSKRTTELTIRSEPGFRPELVPTDPGGAPALFDCGDGWLHLEDLDFRLQPGEDSRPLALVSLTGKGQCTLKGCVVTLDPGGSGAPLSVATIPESAGDMEARPHLAFDGCFLRGEGDAVRDRSGRSFDLQARKTLAVLTGSFLSVDTTADASTGGQSVRATLEKVTTYLTDHLVRLQAGREQRAPVPVKCEAKACLFVAAQGRSLVHLDGPETSEDRLRERLVWTGDGNAYGNLRDRMFDQGVPGNEMEMPGPIVGAERWKSLFKEEGNAIFLPNVRFAAAPAVEAFSRVEPPQMRPVATSLKELGAGPNVPMPATGER